MLTWKARSVEIGARLAEKRKELGWSQSELGAKVGFTKQMVSRIERGVPRPKIEQIGPLADVLAVPFDWLYSSTRKAS